MSQLESILENSVLVIDEAHNLIKIIGDFYNILQEPPSASYNQTPMSKEKKLREKEDMKRYKEQTKLFIKFIHILRSPHKLMLLTGTPMRRRMSDIRYLINIAAGKTVVPWMRDEFELKYTEKTMTKQATEVLYITSKYIGLDNVLEDEDGAYYLKTQIDSYLEKLFFSMESFGSPINFIRSFVVEKITKMAVKKTKKLKLVQFKRSDNVMGKYVSFYKYSDTSEYYPKFRKQHEIVAYSDYQFNLLERYISSKLTDQESVEMGMNETFEEASFFKIQYEYLSDTQRLDYGRIIGNLGVEPPKFKAVLDHYKSVGYKKTLVYSNFYKSGILKMAEYLKSQGIEYYLYEPDLDSDTKNQIMAEFDSKETGIMLLHPDYFEGFSVLKVRFLHVLEPMMEYYKIEQLHTRVIRYNSHITLPKEDRQVTIIQWSSRSYNFFKKLLIKYNLVESWWNQAIDFIENILDIFVNTENELIDSAESNEVVLKRLQTFSKQLVLKIIPLYYPHVAFMV